MNFAQNRGQQVLTSFRGVLQRRMARCISREGRLGPIPAAPAQSGVGKLKSCPGALVLE